MRTLVVGAGALGGYFGARLLAAGRDVTFLVRPRRAQQLADDGLRLVSPNGDLHIPHPATVLAEQLNAPFDIILLSCKAPDLAGAIDSFAPAVGPESAIIPLLNGMAHMQALDRRFGIHCVFGGVSNISAVREDDGLIRHLNTLDRLYFGERVVPAGSTSSERLQRVARVLVNAGFDAHLRPGIMQDMWEKWAAIATGAITCLMRASVGDLVKAGGAGLARQLLAECASVAAAEGFPPGAAFLQQVEGFLTQPGSPFTTSMLRDLEAGGAIERQHIIGDLLRLGQHHALATPLLEIVNTHLCCYEERRQRESA